MKKENIEKTAEELFSDSPSKELVETVIKAVQSKKETDSTSKCNADFVINVIRGLGKESMETVLDTMITTAMLLPTPMLMYSIHRLKDLASFKMLEDLSKMAGSDFDIDTEKRVKESQLLKDLEKLAKDMKNIDLN